MIVARIAAAALAGLLSAAAAAQVAVPAGEQVFNAQCAACHQAGGKGMPGMAPALAGALAPAFAKEGGQRYVMQVLLNGLSGKIVSQGKVFMLAMAPKKELSDADLANVANYVAQDLNAVKHSPYTAADFQAARSQAVSHQALRELRAQLLP